MKRAGNLYESIADPDNLRLAFIKATRGKRHKPEVIAYRTNLDENLQSLRNQLLARDVDVGHYHFFTGTTTASGLLCPQLTRPAGRRSADPDGILFPHQRDKNQGAAGVGSLLG